MSTSSKEFIDTLLRTIANVRDKLAKRVDSLDARLTALEQRPPSPAYEGVHESGKSYARGALVTRSGGLWLATRDTAQTPGHDPVSWKLIVKSGQGGGGA